MQSRRQFLSDSLRAGAALTIAPTTRFTEKNLPHVSLSRLHHRTFVPHVNSLFHVTHAGYKMPLLLTETTTSTLPSGETFSLRFRGSARFALEQGTYRFEHNGLGAFDLFIVPGAATKTTQHYRAIINRV
jgi:hypothetical protein